MIKRLPLLFRHVMYNLRGGFLVRPLTITLVLGFAGALLSEAEEMFPSVSAWVPKTLFPSHADPQVAQVILGAIASSIMTVVSIVFAILLMTLTLASMQFSPRILAGFVRDRVTQWTLGVFLGTFSYCMAALPAARSVPYAFSPVVTVMGAMILAFACVCLLLFFIHHISQAISVNQIVDRIASETEAVIDDLMPELQRYPRMASSYYVDLNSWKPAVVNETAGYIRYVDRTRLIDLTKTYHVQVHCPRRVGHFVPAGIPILLASKPERITEQAAKEFLAAFDIGPTRTLQQDIEFGVLQMVDIALRAISPAVNDPTSAISCVDQLSRVLIRFVSRRPAEQFIFDPPGVFRVSIPWIGFQGLLRSAFEQIRLYAKGDVAVSLRLLRAIGDVASATEDSDYRKALCSMGKNIAAGCAEKLTELELRDVEVRAKTVESFCCSALSQAK
ncbi:MAG TPA: DUF2254 domain-containing protein [Verrucomicrobiae bacterium]|jgi:uncharacterized membrane protein|nr:DUF2254 domain-containing protein [Verrucomicrobiae bacterium]